jgi:DNA-binding transcriptional LysR family regulator
MDIQSVQAFVEVSDSGSFSRAARALFLTQPAVSKRIQSLELALDVKLFDRIGKRVQLTEAGRALLPSCRRILDEIDESQRIISNLRGATRGRLRLATSHHIGLHRLPAALREYANNWPLVELELRFIPSELACEQVINGTIELALITLPESADERLLLQPVWQDPMYAVVSSEHALAARNRVTRAQLLQYPAVLPSHGSYTRQLIDTALDLDETVNTLLETDYLETIKAMVQAGLGWSMLPESMLDDSLCVLQLPRARIARSLGIVIHGSRTRSAAANAMMELLRRG